MKCILNRIQRITVGEVDNVTAGDGGEAGEGLSDGLTPPLGVGGAGVTAGITAGLEVLVEGGGVGG